MRAVTGSMLYDFYALMVDGLRERGFEVVPMSSPDPEVKQLKAKCVRRFL